MKVHTIYSAVLIKVSTLRPQANRKLLAYQRQTFRRCRLRRMGKTLDLTSLLHQGFLMPVKLGVLQSIVTRVEIDRENAISKRYSSISF